MSSPSVFSLLSTAASTTASYLVYGPPRPSWSLKHTIYLNVMRGQVFKTPRDSKDPVEARANFLRAVTPGTPENTNRLAKMKAADIELAKRSAPPADDFVFYEVGVPVQRYQLPGVLADIDAKECERFDDPKARKIPAEWSVARTVLRDIEKTVLDQTKVNSAGDDGRKTDSAVSESLVMGPARKGEKLILYLHGGGHVAMSPLTHRIVVHQISQATGLRVISVDYRLAPNNPFPAGLQDAVAVFMHLIDPNGPYRFEPQNIVVAGDSAGGNLSLATLLYLRDHNLPQFGGGFLISPWMDLNCSSDSWTRNLPYDYLTLPSRDLMWSPSRLYTNPRCESWEEVQELVNHPYVSPIFTPSTRGLPPLLIQFGEVELIRDDIAKFAERVQEEAAKQDEGVDGVNALPPPTKIQSEEYTDGVHVFHFFVELDQAKKAYKSLGEWTRNIVWSTTTSKL
ncbi:alpha/beta-hydrolase [Ramicandelaber brevisporus]|nr:alpha/beta-hydrolase [Ramicandelaber brevisporus]